MQWITQAYELWVHDVSIILPWRIANGELNVASNVIDIRMWNLHLRIPRINWFNVIVSDWKIFILQDGTDIEGTDRHMSVHDYVSKHIEGKFVWNTWDTTSFGQQDWVQTVEDPYWSRGDSHLANIRPTMEEIHQSMWDFEDFFANNLEVQVLRIRDRVSWLRYAA